MRTVIARFGGCLPLLTERQRRVLRLRAGVGPARPASRTRVARMLELPVVRVRRAERRGLRALVRAGRDGCAATAGDALAGDLDDGAASSVLAADTPSVLTEASPDGDVGGAGATGDAREPGDREDGDGAGGDADGAGTAGTGGVKGITAVGTEPAGGDVTVPLILAALMALAGGLVALRTRERGLGRFRLPSVAPLQPIAALAALLPGERLRSAQPATVPRGPRPGSSEPAAADLRPPNPRRPWRAEVEWAETRFAVVARTGDADPGIVLATIGPLHWPPAGVDSVSDLKRAVERLEAALLAAGWAALPPGSAWYAKRFAWAAEPGAAGGLHRCEITWQAGYRNSSFGAVMHGPAGRRGTTLGRSRDHKWLFKADPDQDDAGHVAEVRRLAERLVAAGWEPAGRGRSWYALRFLWRRDEDPPDRLPEA